jgi:hypothetical protein
MHFNGLKTHLIALIVKLVFGGTINSIKLKCLYLSHLPENDKKNVNPAPSRSKKGFFMNNDSIGDDS